MIHAVAGPAATGTPGAGTGGTAYRYGDEHQPVTTADILTPRAGRITVRTCGVLIRPSRRICERRDFRSQCKRKTYPYPGHYSIDTDIKLNRALWVMAETLWRACADAVSLSEGIIQLSFLKTHIYLLFKALSHENRFSESPTIYSATTPENNPPQLVASSSLMNSASASGRSILASFHRGDPGAPSLRLDGPSVRRLLRGIWNLYTLNNGGAFMAPEPMMMMTKHGYCSMP